MAIHGLWVINKAGGLVYQRNFGGSSRFAVTCNSPLLTTSPISEGLPGLTSNEYLVLAGTLHGIHAITSRLSPAGTSSGAQVIEGETFKMTIMLTATGTKFVLLTSLAETTADVVLQKVYEVYADAVMKNPFHTPEMPIRSDGFDRRITALLG
ncbi:Sybindin-like protein [Cristinia sonorae]|uniref:Trafficking protein particle complex subunit n=1 Tax=Cristinia sonorae TaxID=1940300 RepID=A0A8K0XUU4_9AGAR|nr:Sybindin-like protein [Cristinia sonorae]